MSDSIEIMNKIWTMLVDYNIKSFHYDSDSSGESIKTIFEDAPQQELQMYSLLKPKVEQT